MVEAVRDKVLTVQVNDAEFDMAKAEAQKLGMPVSSFIRLLLKNWANGVTFENK